MKEDTNILMLLALLAAGFLLWHQFSTNQSQEKLQNCQLEFKNFKDGVIYGK